MLLKNLIKSTLALAVILMTTSTVFAQQYNNGYYPQQNYQQYNYQYQGNNGYYSDYQPVYNQGMNDPYAYNPNYAPQQVYQQPYYGQPVYNTDTRNEKIKKALTYSALGAGAGYFFSKDGKKTKNTLLGAGVGAALGYFLNRY